jgi:hypothetical protein
MKQFTFNFEEIQLLPQFVGSDGKSYGYGDQLITGSVDIAANSDEDWWIEGVYLKTDEPNHTNSCYKWRSIEQVTPIFEIVKAAVIRQCSDAIEAKIGERE